MNDKEIIQRILDLKKAKNVTIFAHNYQRPEIYDVADELGDSFDLAQRARELQPERIIFCGVTFMAEMVKILSPESRVFIPSMQAVCPMAAMITREKLLDLKEKHPGAAVMCYVNTTADTKTLCDICCTSANAVDIANKLPADEIIFVPDQNLAAYVQSNTKKKIIAPEGWCYVHAKITEEKILEAKKNYPDAKAIVHPECKPEVLKRADAVLSTTGMIKYVKESDVDTIIVATEIGMLELLRRHAPNKKFFSIGGECIQQKKITLENLLECLEKDINEIVLPDDVMAKALAPLEKMLEYGRND
ncbi:MAG: quinolinate synthase NadA [Patescibacteria group bacterium]|nr:quinolinate synthase NadA [Patescibacteria group bacterium]